MTPAQMPRKAGVVLLAAAAAAAFWVGWGLGLVPRGLSGSILGAGMLAAVLLLLLGTETRSLAGTLLGLCPTAALIISLVGAEDLISVAGGLRLWPLFLSLFAAMLTLSLIPGAETRAGFARAGVVLAGALTVAVPLGAATLVDRWVLQTPVHLAITFATCLVLSGQARSALIGPPKADEARLMSGMTQLLPLLGFAGTVWGIMVALEALPAIFAADTPSTEALQHLLGGLGTAFETTLLGLFAAVLVAVVAMLLPDPDERP
jgi:hypothetical protein